MTVGFVKFERVERLTQSVDKTYRIQQDKLTFNVNINLLMYTEYSFIISLELFLCYHIKYDRTKNTSIQEPLKVEVIF